MPKPFKSQWEFGELFPSQPPPTAAVRKVWSVSEFTGQVRRFLEREFPRVWITGEVTNLRLQASGHVYFTLKDASAQLSCVLFRGESQADRSVLQDGRKLTVEGETTVYEPRGQYQLRVLRIELEGIGALQVAFEKLKQKLKSEGLFDAQRKRPLPRYPQAIGLVTSPTGAAIQDIIHVVQRRNPALRIVLAPCRVQGEGAAGEIASAIRMLNDFHAATERAATGRGKRTAVGGPKLDLILVARGGGSLEDLWQFNEEMVARAVYESALPVVSAVGHEIDFTICDFVADLRAATPSAAAEIITEGVFASGQFLSTVALRLQQLAGSQMEIKRQELARTGQRLARTHPRRRLNDSLQRLDDLRTSLVRDSRQGFKRQQAALSVLAERLNRARPRAVLRQHQERLTGLRTRLRELAIAQLQRRKAALEALAAQLRLLGPEQVLARGYSITFDAATGQVLRRSDQVAQGDTLRTRLQDGEIISRVQ